MFICSQPAIFFAFILVPFSNAIRCYNVEKNPQARLTASGPDCEGELCVILKNRQGSNQRQNCLTGYPFNKLKIGCRVNREGALLCLCNSGPRCNTLDILKSAAENLPVVRCRNFVESPYLAYESVDTKCEGNACFYERNLDFDFYGRKIIQNQADCSVFPDQVFDILVSPSPFSTA